MQRRYFIKTFGCQMNEYDSARMADVLSAGGDLTATEDPAEADVLLMNTCSVREKEHDVGSIDLVAGEVLLDRAEVVPQLRQ